MNEDTMYDQDRTLDDPDMDNRDLYDPDMDNRDLGDRGAEDQGRGAKGKLSGKVKEAWGQLTGDKSDELQGKTQQGKGSFEQGAGRVASDMDDTLDR